MAISSAEISKPDLNDGDQNRMFIRSKETNCETRNAKVR